MPAARPEEGTTSNRYTILGRLAGGGMADIYLAKSTSEGGVERYVVLKRVLAERSRDPHFATMFLDEARLAAQLQHPNIAQVLDIGTLGGSQFFTMEYVHGEDVRVLLQGCVASGRALPVNLALHIAAGALAALQHAHTRAGTDGRPLGIVHRDVSPSNVMVSYEGAVKLLDFGVAKATQQSEQSQSGSIKGKIGYLSPEQCKGKGVDRRSDLFALGVVLFEMLTMQRLYKRDNDFAAMMAIATEQPPLPSALRPGISPALDHIVMTALAKEPEQRYASASDMLEAIEHAAAAGHYVMSATAMGRFLREVFGERPEPWAQLPAATARMTGELTEVSVTTSFGSALEVADAALLDQLEHAPLVGRGETPSGVSLPAVALGTTQMVAQLPVHAAAVPMIVTHSQAQAYVPPSVPPALVTHSHAQAYVSPSVPPAMVTHSHAQAYAPPSVPPAMVTHSHAQAYAPPVPLPLVAPVPASSSGSPRIVIAGVAAATIGAALVAWKLLGGSAPAPRPSVAPPVVSDAAVAEPEAAQPPPLPVDAAVAAPVHVDAAVVRVDAAVVHVDAAVVVHVDAAVAAPVHVDAAVAPPDAAVGRPQPLPKPKPKPPKSDPCDANPLKCQK